MSDNERDSIDKRNYQEMSEMLALSQHVVYKKYLTELSEYYVVKPTEEIRERSIEKSIRGVKLVEFTNKKGEDVFQKLSTVYNASMALGSSLYIMIDVKENNAPANIYLGVKNDNDRNLKGSYNTLKSGLTSNFPGTKIQEISASQQLKKQLEEIFDEGANHISSVSGVAGIRGKEKTEHKNFIQGIEKLIDAMRGHTYTALFIAEPVSSTQQSKVRIGYENMYSTLSAFRKSTWSYNENESVAVMHSLSEGTSETHTEGTNQTKTYTEGSSNSFNIGGSVGGFTSQAISKPADRVLKARQLQTVGTLAQSIAPLTAAIPVAGPILSVGLEIVGGVTTATGSIMEKLFDERITNTIGKSLGVNVGFSHSSFKSNAETFGRQESESNTHSKQETNAKTETNGIGRTIQIEYVNKSIEELLKRIDEQLKRMGEFEDYGAYNCGAYFMSSKKENSLLAANTYRALMLGDGTGVEYGAVNSWSDKIVVEVMKEYLKKMEQPIFAMPIRTEDEAESMFCSASTMVSGLELPLHLSLPTKSVVGLPVIEHAEFGRNVNVETSDIILGDIYHMGQMEEGTCVSLNPASMTSHTFITGSTGSGKSNTIYQLLDEFMNMKVPFLVIEPAKGEYKKVFGGRENVYVYGTNIKKSPLLRLNPFSFPEDIHILEHIDRLVEIFNACWPMYAAMPAVLKDAVERVYCKRGWDLCSSTCNPRVFPTFQDLMEELPKVIEESAYSGDTKGDYIGALVTRVKSLTNGINGQIFCTRNELSYEELFERNVIVDISRVGSVETKSLLMGILVMKLQEFHMSKDKVNEKLSHITVLEEAHNLLRRTSDIQLQESANLQGKSVEMISNAIAEMRTYGEGFIIADQAPGLLDEAVIRNTNTKIILRLFEEDDRIKVGKAISLKDEQIEELAKLQQGVGVVYQNGWNEPVLCKVRKFENEKETPYVYKQDIQKIDEMRDKFLAYLASESNNIPELSKEAVDNLQVWMEQAGVGLGTQENVNKIARGDFKPNIREKRRLCYEVIKGRKYIYRLEELADTKNGFFFITEQIMQEVGISRETASEVARSVILYALNSLEKGERYNRLLTYGGIK